MLAEPKSAPRKNGLNGRENNSERESHNLPRRNSSSNFSQSSSSSYERGLNAAQLERNETELSSVNAEAEALLGKARFASPGGKVSDLERASSKTQRPPAHPYRRTAGDRNDSFDFSRPLSSSQLYGLAGPTTKAVTRSKRSLSKDSSEHSTGTSSTSPTTRRHSGTLLGGDVGMGTGDDSILAAGSEGGGVGGVEDGDLSFYDTFRSDILVVAIAGGTGSGKTSLARAIRQQLEESHPGLTTYISHDNYYKGTSIVPF